MRHSSAIFVLLIYLFLGGGSETSFAGWFSKSDEEQLQERVTKLLDSQKQGILESFHLLAVAKELEVQKFVLVDEAGNPTSKLKNSAGYAVVFTIFWKSDLRDDGYLKVFAFYDGSVNSYTETKVLATNGVLNQDVAAEIGNFLSGLLSPQ